MVFKISFVIDTNYWLVYLLSGKILRNADIHHLPVRYIKYLSHLINMQWDCDWYSSWQKTKMKNRFGQNLVISGLLGG